MDGTRLADRYEVGDVLGHGGMGEVRAGYDTRLDRDVAIKFLRADLASDPEVTAAFEREARAAAQLSHPNAVAIYDTDEQADGPYIVMERLPGRTLADEIKDGPLEPLRLRRVAVQVLAALQSAHDAGIIHRDIKPGNVLLTEGGDVKVSDFGIAKSLKDDTTTTGPLFATLAYVAPERLRGEKATPTSDLYSVGVLLYEAATGRRPFAPETPATILTAMDAPRALTEISDLQLRSAIERAMARDPSDRFSNAHEMAVALDPAVAAPASADPEATTPITARTSTTTAALPAPPSRRSAPERTAEPRSGVFARRRSVSPTLIRAALVGAVIAVLVLLGVVLTSGGDDAVVPTVTPSTAATPTNPATPGLPQPLADALDRLDETIDR